MLVRCSFLCDGIAVRDRAKPLQGVTRSTYCRRSPEDNCVTVDTTPKNQSRWS